METIYLITREDPDWEIYEIILLTTNLDTALQHALTLLKTHYPTTQHTRLSIHTAHLNPTNPTPKHQLTEIRAYSNYNDGGINTEPNIWISGT